MVAASKPAEPADSKSEMDDETWRFDNETIFQEAPHKHAADPIGEPLPHEYKDNLLMLPPAYDALGVKSRYITPQNLDDFASSVREKDDSTLR